ncbi:S-adenosyl-L-methionine-dependent methyltransferase [Immersiella caudata]|uniref:S-adenosyl-L-methionine-dependent methyltransferase n=1 Tax=Immersiella caudata TaxID=314043 RepID=A0AA39X517_9PEZI|nr:S-adenosyl-L-methionine-dependent methyltransferase [Immersiella caudata]
MATRSWVAKGTLSASSLNSTILQYRNLHGRTYQNFGGDINHHLLTTGLVGKLYLNPLDKPTNVLDVGTSTGIWALDFADEFPHADFVIDDASKPWTCPDDTFDYIHIHYMLGTFKDWVAVYREVCRCLGPGGWIEHADVSHNVQGHQEANLKLPVGAWPADKALRELGSVHQASLVTGLDGFGMYVLTHVMGWKVKAGLTNKSHHGYCVW